VVLTSSKIAGLKTQRRADLVGGRAGRLGDRQDIPLLA
jgi:hypothetical protein